jgi:hypothetical protein
LTKIELDPSNEDYDHNPSTTCPTCDEYLEGLAEAQTDFWYDFNQGEFASIYLKCRGYDGEPKSWYAVGCYIEHFLDGDKEKPDAWKGQEVWDEAYDIVEKFFDKEPIKGSED